MFISKFKVYSIYITHFKHKHKNMSNVEFVTIEQDDILTHDKNKYNSNNHWLNDIKPINYDKIINQSKTSLWINKFHTDYKIIEITNNEQLNWMKKAYEISSQTGKFSQIYSDELDDFIENHKNMKYFENNNKYFVRTDDVSLKYGEHGVCPYNNLKKIIESLVSSIRTHTPIKNNTTKINIYLLPWINIEPWKEFRIFVNNNKITAISQQNIYCVYNKLSNKIILFKFANIIINYFNSVVKNKINHVQSYTYDFAILDDDEPYFIELNSFGKEYAAGSALFHWLLDEDILYGKHNKIQFRYTI